MLQFRHKEVFSFVFLGKMRYIMRFKIGDLIVYGETGVCKVIDIVEKDFLDKLQNCYKLQPVYQSCVIFTPADNESVFMRPILTQQEAADMINTIANTSPEEYTAPSPRALSEVYDKIIKSHDPFNLLKLIRSIYYKKQKMIEAKRKLSAIDERYLKRAEDLLYGELAISLNMEKAPAINHIKEKVTNF